MRHIDIYTITQAWKKDAEDHTLGAGEDWLWRVG